MEDLKVKELIEICQELGLDLGRAKRKQAILEVLRKENVTAEEVNEARAEIKERREREEAKERREREEAERQERREEAERQERREEAERREREAERQLELKRLEHRQGSPAPSVASATVQASGLRSRDQRPPFVVQRSGPEHGESQDKREATALVYLDIEASQENEKGAEADEPLRNKDFETRAQSASSGQGMALTSSQAGKLSQKLDSSPAGETRKDAEQRGPSYETTKNSRGGIVAPPTAEAGCVKPFGVEAQRTQLGDTNATLPPVSEKLLRENELKVEALPREKSITPVANDFGRDRTAVSQGKGLTKGDNALAETSDRGPCGSADRVHASVSGSTISADRSESREAFETVSNRSARDCEVSLESVDSEASQTKPLEPPKTEGVPSGASSNSGEVVAKPASGTRETSEQRSPCGERPESSGSSLAEPPTAEARCVIPIGGETQVGARCEADSMLSPVHDDLLVIGVGHFHPHSKPVERRRSVRKRKFRALGLERNHDWEACAPAAMLALKSAPLELASVRRATLVYDRGKRTRFEGRN